MTEAACTDFSASRKPLISICIATYNQQAYIREAVMSVIAQEMRSNFELEILIGDDGSSDETPRILNELAAQYPDTVFITRHHPNIGSGANYQSLIKQARGEFIAHLDGDDCWLPGKLLSQIEFLYTHSECIAVYAGAIVTDSERNLLGSFTNKHPAILSLELLLAEGNFLCHSTMLYRAVGAEIILKLDSIFLDYEIHLMFATEHMLGFLNQQLAIYRSLISGSLTRDSQPMIDRIYFNILEKYLPLVSCSVRTHAVAHYATNALASSPRKIIRWDFYRRILLMKDALHINIFTLIIATTSSIASILKVKISRKITKHLNPYEEFFVFNRSK